MENREQWSSGFAKPVEASPGQNDSTRNEVRMPDASHMTAEAGQVAAQLSSTARAYGASIISQQLEKASDKLGLLGTLIRSSSEKLQSEQDPTLAGYVGVAAEQAERAAAYLKDSRVEDIYQDVQSLARRRPELVVGGMFVAGVALARFLKAGKPVLIPSTPHAAHAIPRPRRTFDKSDTQTVQEFAPIEATGGLQFDDAPPEFAKPAIPFSEPEIK